VSVCIPSPDAAHEAAAVAALARHLDVSGVAAAESAERLGLSGAVEP
jgi:hypothetical protein